MLLSRSLAVLALLLALAPLSPGFVSVAQANTAKCGPITSNQTWTPAGSPYIVTCDVQVQNGVTLTIQPGVTVKFDAGTSLRVDGTLVAQRATFTSNTATPARDDWGNIFFSASSVDAVLDGQGNYVGGSSIQDCVVEYGGAGVGGAIQTDMASPFIKGNEIRNNGSSGIKAVARSAGLKIVIRLNRISGNQIDDWSAPGGGIDVVAGQIINKRAIALTSMVAALLRLSGLGKDVYYVVTAYDFLGRESLYSNVVSPPGKNYLPLVVNRI